VVSPDVPAQPSAGSAHRREACGTTGGA